MLTIFGVAALTFMMAMYALERRHRHFVLAFAAGCALSSGYGFASGAWPFGAVEAIWTLIALRRWFSIRPGPRPAGAAQDASGQDGSGQDGSGQGGGGQGQAPRPENT